MIPAALVINGLSVCNRADHILAATGNDNLIEAAHWITEKYGPEEPDEW